MLNIETQSPNDFFFGLLGCMGYCHMWTEDDAIRVFPFRDLPPDQAIENYFDCIEPEKVFQA